MLSLGNHKIKNTGKALGKKSACFDLPAGHTCPMANLCKSKVVIRNGSRKRVDYGTFVCYATKAELCYPSTYNLRRENYKQSKLKSFEKRIKAELTQKKIEVLRIHSSGDFYNWTYFKKWVEIARSNPTLVIYGYSKQASFVKWLQDNQDSVPNFRLVYSQGGLMDAYAKQNNLPTCYVVENEDNPPAPVICNGDDTEDYHYILAGKSFSLLLH